MSAWLFLGLLESTLLPKEPGDPAEVIQALWADGLGRGTEMH